MYYHDGWSGVRRCASVSYGEYGIVSRICQTAVNLLLTTDTTFLHPEGRQRFH